MITNYIDHIYILNLEYRKDKLFHTINELKKNNINNYEIFKGYNPKINNIPEEYINRINSKGFVVTPPLCALFGHLDIIKDAKSKGYEKILILEDDIIFKDNFNETIDDIFKKQLKTINWDALWLGANIKFTKIPFKKHNLITENIAKIENLCGAFCYILKDITYDFIINNSIENIFLINSEDKYKNGYTMDTFYENFLFNKFNCYYTVPTMCLVKEFYSDAHGFFLPQQYLDNRLTY